MSYQQSISLQRSAISRGLSMSVECSCGSFDSLSSLFFCRDCRLLHCLLCTSGIIDSFYCDGCLNTVFTSKTQETNNR